MDCTELVSFRAGLYSSFTRGADGLMNTSDALLTETSARSFPELSLSPSSLGDGRACIKGFSKVSVIEGRFEVIWFHSLR